MKKINHSVTLKRKGKNWIANSNEYSLITSEADTMLETLDNIKSGITTYLLSTNKYREPFEVVLTVLK